MDALRLSLIIIGIVIIAAVYWWSRRESKPLVHRRTPSISPDIAASVADTTIVAEADLQSLGTVIPGHEKVIASDTKPLADEIFHATSRGEQIILSLTILGHHGRRFTGEAIVQAMHDQKLVFGDMRIFHYFTATNQQQALFSVANILEPGIFNIDTMHDFTTPGLVIFMRLPGPQEPRVALDTLLKVARGLTEQLQGELCDESRSALTQQTIGYLREKVEAFRFKHKFSQLGVKGE